MSAQSPLRSTDRIVASASSLRAHGKRARAATPLDSLAEVVPTDRDPVAIVESQNANRVQELLPLRKQRMSQSPFAFFRGSAGLMAHDLAAQSQTGVQVVICGDAHIGNFGLYASPERRIIFDLNDFDEAAPGPWEWDVRRLTTSAYLAAEEIGATPAEALAVATNSAMAYGRLLRSFLRMPPTTRHYFALDETLAAQALLPATKPLFAAAVKKARRRNSERVMRKKMGPDAFGVLRFAEDPPVTTHVPPDVHSDINGLFEEYRQTTAPDIDLLLSTYSLTDVARRVVGVGSVGTNCFVVALTSQEGDGLVLQMKEATTSVVEQYSTPNATTPHTVRDSENHGKRVVDQQRILQAFSDPFLGFLTAGSRSYYVRQFQDSKGSFDLTAMDLEEMDAYSRTCAAMLARSHSQSPWAHWISGYIGKSTRFQEAIGAWSAGYAQQVHADFAVFTQ